MIFYIVVEGKRTEKHVFKRWIPALCPDLRYVDHPKSLVQNSFTIVSGNGYPGYLRIIRDAAIDVRDNPGYGTLLVSVDADDKDADARRQEVLDVIRDAAPGIQPIVIIQNQCIETWALGNRRMVKNFPRDREHQEWKQHYDVWALDPEELPPNLAKGLNRAQSALVYLLAAIRDRNPSLSYSKAKPNVLADPAYLEQLRVRSNDTGHIPSFKEFCDVFS